MTSAPSPSTPETQFNPLLFAHHMTEASKVWQDILKIISQEDAFASVRSGNDSTLWNMASDYTQWMSNALKDPTRVMQLSYVWMANATALWQETMQSFLEADASEMSRAAPDTANDRRFANEAWQNNAFFDYVKKHYLMTSAWTQDAMERLDDSGDAHQQKKLQFYTRQWLDALAPSNFLITNPEVLQASLETNGETILKGLMNLRADVERGKGRLAISTTDNKAFEVGKNLAATKGSVIYHNDLMQLIQYAPQTEKVHAIPLLLIPAWINKFYIFDMQKKNSLVQWLLEQGYSVFVISWVNPETKHKDYSLEHYITDGLLKAVEVVQSVAKTESVSCVGYCLGGTLLATTLAYLHAKGEQGKIASATYLTTMVDFSEPGELGVFIDEEQIQSIEAKMEKKGYLEGADMAATFSLLRSNNMIWSFVINNYLLGKEPFPFDLLYWNSDCTRMPAALHSFCLRNFYHQNRLATPNALTLAGQSIDVTRIATPAFILSTREDHIAPWSSTYASTQLYCGDITFALAGSGHIAGVINPPTKEKYGYCTGETKRGMTAEKWLAQSKEHAGSWWGYWDEWQQRFHKEASVNARDVGNAEYPPLENAPGSYVKQ
jgi:polyhydroxyalkanoate synthase subunit PhaC